MYIDHEGHRMATNLADAAGELTAHEQAAYFGYDCPGACCNDPEVEQAHPGHPEDDTELVAALLGSDEWQVFDPHWDTDDSDEPPF